MLIEANLVFAFDVIDSLGKPLSISDKVSRHLSVYSWYNDAVKLLDNYIEVESKFGWLASKALKKTSVIEVSYTDSEGQVYILMEEGVERVGVANHIAHEINPFAAKELLSLLSFNHHGQQIVNPFRSPCGKHVCKPEDYGFSHALFGSMFKLLESGDSLFLSPSNHSQEQVDLNEQNACLSLHSKDQNLCMVRVALSFLNYAVEHDLPVPLTEHKLQIHSGA